MGKVGDDNNSEGRY